MTINSREPWQETGCYYSNGGICLAKCAIACLCQNGHLTMQLMFEDSDLKRSRTSDQVTTKSTGE